MPTLVYASERIDFPNARQAPLSGRVDRCKKPVHGFDGVVAVPGAMMKEVIDLAMAKVRRENDSRAELMQRAFLRDVFAKYQVL